MAQDAQSPTSVTTEERSKSEPAAPTRWQEHATRVLKVEMARRDMSFKELAALLARDEPTFEDTAVSLTKRVKRGTLPFALSLHILRVLGVTSLDISYLKTGAEYREAQEAKKKRR
jgi:hypothetical protein